MADVKPPVSSDPKPSTGAPAPKKYGGYGKRPLWQWVLIYLVIGGLVYYLAYYFFFRGNSSLYGGSSTNQTQPY